MVLGFSVKWFLLRIQPCLVPGDGDVPSAHTACRPRSCRIQSRTHGLGWQDGSSAELGDVNPRESPKNRGFKRTDAQIIAS